MRKLKPKSLHTSSNVSVYLSTTQLASGAGIIACPTGDTCFVQSILLASGVSIIAVLPQVPDPDHISPALTHFVCTGLTSHHLDTLMSYSRHLAWEVQVQ